MRLKENSDLRTNCKQLEQILLVKEDIGAQLEFSNQKLLKAVQDKEHFKDQLKITSEYLDSLSEKNFDLERLSKYLKQVVEERELYAENLKKMILDIKEKSQIYIPSKVNSARPLACRDSRAKLV